MENVNLRYICKTWASLSGVPTRVYSGDELIFQYSVISLSRDPIEICRQEIWEIKDHVGYYISPRFHVYGIVNAGDLKVVVGPTAQVMANDQSLRELAFELNVPKEEVPDFVSGMKSIVRLPLESLLMMLCPVNYLLNDEELELKDILILDTRQTEMKKRVEHQRTEKIYNSEPDAMPHNTLQLEEMIINIVRKGDTAALRQWAATAPPVRGGTIAGDQLRQLKNTFIVIATLTSRAAIRGGMDADDALSLSDAYIQRAELLATQNEIVNLQFNMVMEYTEQVEKIRHGKTPSKLQVEVANYIQHHLSEPISTEEMAKQFYLTRTHFSSKFKAETGMTLTDFILNEKTEEAKRLLRYSDKSVAAIGTYLGFSSHGHFTKVFKKYTSLTPNEYREKYR